MESSSWPGTLSCKRLKAIQELTRGQQLTNKLREMLGQQEKIESDLMLVDGVVAEILGMFDNTLSILNSYTFNEKPHIQTHDMRFQSSVDDQQSHDSGESEKSVRPVKNKRGCYKRGRTSSTFTKVTSTLIDDGYAWRKYGQKPILNAKYQRNYFRCTHKGEQGCQATKQVQKTDDEPPKYVTTYNGHHTCKNLQTASHIILDTPNNRDNSFLLNFETSTPTENKPTSPCLISMKQTPKEDLPSLCLENEQASSSNNHTPWDPLTKLSQVSFEPMSMILSGFDHEDMIFSEVFSSTCSTNCYKIDDMIGINDFGELLYECFSPTFSKKEEELVIGHLM
ncbi:WRKY domain-containing protein [Artemisia annua]|uniref:WRKY domain-containing protein n=1 Tax=Artemisia annua TaxID=35608 RepID=A0A2U1M2H2_ARTAN|nr:WRKY domain-containing protein [Artemisia annua]